MNMFVSYANEIIHLSDRIWDVQKGQLEYNIEGNEYGFLSLTYSPENQLIVGGDYQGTVKV